MIRVFGGIVLASAGAMLWFFGDNVLAQFYSVTAVCGGGLAAMQDERAVG